MLRPDQDRLNYGELLAPPSEEYHLDFAVGTTYSLDLDALVGATMSLGLSEETDSNLSKDPVYLLAALNKTAHKVALFCEAGQIHIPGNVTEIYILLEKMVYSVALPGTKKNKYASFHPKFWLIRYVNNNEEVMYRVVVLSRNLTFDRSWDVTYYMDAYPCEEEQTVNYPVCDFIRYLAKNWLTKDEYANEKRKQIYRICRELPYFEFEPTDHFKDFEFLPNNIPKYSGKDEEDESGKYLIRETPLFQESFNELLVMSPFLSNKVLKDIQNKSNRMTSQKYKLFTRKESVSKLKADDCADFDIYCLKDRVVQGEDYLGEDNPKNEVNQTGKEQNETVSNLQKQDIHAKLYFARKGSYTRLYLGSLNASDNGLNNNIEFMICLQDMEKFHNLKMDDLCTELFDGDENSPENPFEKVEIKEEKKEEEITGNDLEFVVKTICRDKQSYAEVQNIGKDYTCTLHFSEDTVQETKVILNDINGKATVRPLFARTEGFELGKEIQFNGLTLLNLSAFYVITVSTTNDTVRRVVEIETKGIPENREEKIMKTVLNNKECFYRYIAFLLGDNSIISMMEAGRVQIEKGDAGVNGTTILPALYEKMLETAATRPEKLNDIGTLLKVLSQDNSDSDKNFVQFKQLYDTFQKVVK